MPASNTTIDFDFFINQLNVVSSKQYVETIKIVISSSIIDSEMQESIEIVVTYYRCSIRKQDHIRPTYLPLVGSLNLELKLRFITCNTIVRGGVTMSRKSTHLFNYGNIPMSLHALTPTSQSIHFLFMDDFSLKLTPSNSFIRNQITINMSQHGYHP
jgi:hypothetical protein